MVLTAGGCSTGLRPALPGFGGANRTLTSFLGVRFGELLSDVEQQYAGGSPETSPYGSPAYRLENVSAGAIDYRSVIYEFTDNYGMQLVIAHFTDSSTNAVYQQLKQSLGEPSSTGGTNPSDLSTVQVTWRLPAGDVATFSGPKRRITLLGVHGESLKEDIRLRDEGELSADIPHSGPGLSRLMAAWT